MFRKIIAGIALFLFLLSFKKEVEYANYISKQKAEYGILQKRSKIKYVPALVFELYLKLQKRTQKEININILTKSLTYNEVGVSRYFSSLYKDAYITYSYFTNDEKVIYLLNEQKELEKLRILYNKK